MELIPIACVGIFLKKKNEILSCENTDEISEIINDIREVNLLKMFGKALFDYNNYDE